MLLAGGRGTGHVLAKSENGIDWSTTGGDLDTYLISGIAHNGSLWVAGGSALGHTHLLLYSTDDGETWTGIEASDLPLSGVTDIAWNGTMFVAVGEGTSDVIMYSYDGVNWSGAGNPGSEFDYMQAVAWGNSMWIAVGSGTTLDIAYSYDGISWSTQAQTFGDYGGYCIDWNGSYWLVGANAIYDGAPNIYRSFTGFSWTRANVSGLEFDCYGLAHNDAATMWIATGDGYYNGTQYSVIYSYNGLDWTVANSADLMNEGWAAIYYNDLWLIGGNDLNNTLAYSLDGINWTGLGDDVLGSSGVYTFCAEWEADEEFIILLIRQLIQGGNFFVYQGRVYIPDFHCCPLGDYMGVAKLPVPSSVVEPLRVCVNENVTVDLSEAYSPTETALNTYYIDWDDGTTTEGNFPLSGSFTHSWSTPGFKSCYVQIADVDGGQGVEYFEIEVVNCTNAPDDELYIANASGIYKSKDGGVTWELSMNGPAAYAVAADPFTVSQSEKELLAACRDNGLYKTTNSGASWQKIAYAYDALAIAYDKVYKNKFYVLGRDESGDAVVSVTENGGVTWEHYLTGRDAVTTPAHGLLAVAYFEKYLFFVTTKAGGAANENAVYRIATDLTGDTLVADWGEASNLILRISQDDYIYVGGTYNATTQGLFMSDDYGASWKAIGSADWSDMLYTLDVTIDPFNPNNLTAVIARATERVFYVSGDRGDTWKLVTNSNINVNMIERPKNDSETIYIGGTGSTTTLAVSLWNGQDAFTRQASLPAEQTNDIAVVGA